MEELKSLFGEESLSYAQFEERLGKSADIKLANLKSGNYVDKAKYDKVEKSANEWQTKYNALNESTQDYADLKTNNDNLASERDSLKEQLSNIEKMNEVSNAGVNPKFSKFVCGEVSALVSESKDFKTALAEYLNENKEFLSNTKGTFVDLQYGKATPLSNNQKMNNFIRGKK